MHNSTSLHACNTLGMASSVFLERLRSVLKDQGRLDADGDVERGFSSEIARKLDVAPSTVSRWVKGDTIPNGEQFIALAFHLGVAPAALLGLESKQGYRELVLAEVGRVFGDPVLHVLNAIITLQKTEDGRSTVPDRTTLAAPPSAFFSETDASSGTRVPKADLPSSDETKRRGR